MVFEHSSTYDYSIYFTQEQRGRWEKWATGILKRLHKKVKTVAGKDVSKQHFMAMSAAMFYNNGPSLQKVGNMLEIISFTEFMSSYCLARHFIEMC